jgi:hypothetical protein
MAEERKLSHKKQSDNSHHSNNAMDILGRYNNQGTAYLLHIFHTWNQCDQLPGLITGIVINIPRELDYSDVFSES